MKQTKMYEAPKMEIIEMGMLSVLCASVEPIEFNGTGMNFTRGNGQW